MTLLKFLLHYIKNNVVNDNISFFNVFPSILSSHTFENCIELFRNKKYHLNTVIKSIAIDFSGCFFNDTISTYIYVYRRMAVMAINRGVNVRS